MSQFPIAGDANINRPTSLDLGEAGSSTEIKFNVGYTIEIDAVGFRPFRR